MSQQLQITGGAKVRSLEGVITGSTGVLGSLPINGSNGIPQLDSNGKILVSQLPNSVMEYLGTWNAATNTPMLANGTGNAGDVYLCNVAGTVNFGAGPITFYVGDQVIYSGSIWQRAGGSTGSVTSVAVTETGDALTITGSPITTSGTINIGFAGTSGQYVNGAGGLTTFPTLLSSVGLSMPTAFNVSNSPLTANGTIAVTGAGIASQYIRGDGTLANFPSSGGGGSSVSYYLNGSINQGTFGGNTYYEMNKVPVVGVGTDFTINANGYIAQFITDANDPALLEIPGGNWNFEMYFNASSSGGTPSFYVELYKYNGSTFTLIASSSAAPEGITNGTAIDLYTTALAVPTTSLTVTDRLAVRVYVTHSGRTITLHTENSTLCQVITTFSNGITALNGLTAQVQYFGTGTSGSDFNITSATASHTFNLPIASASNTGKLSSTDWTTFNNKQNVLTNPITGTGTTNYIPKFTGSTALGNSTLQEVSSGRLQLGSSSISNAEFDLVSNNAAQFVLYEGYSTTTIQSYNASAFTILSQISGTNTDLFNYDYTSKFLSFGTNGTEKLRISSTGNVSIGNVNNTYKLEVNGTGKFSGQLTLGSTITNGTYTYTLPSATGTLAIRSDLDAYVTLGTSQVITGAKVFDGSAAFSSTGGVLGIEGGASVYKGLALAKGFPPSIFVTGFSSLYSASGNNNIVINDNSNSSKLQFQATSSYTYTFPANTGTIALLSDIPVSGVTSVTATSPLFSSGGLTPNITIQVANTSQNGYLSSTDWNTFNGKQNALTNPITGTGVSGRIPYFNGTTTQTSTSNLTWDNTGNFISTSGVYVYNTSTNAYMLTSNGDNIGSVFNVSSTTWGLGYGSSTSSLATRVLSWNTSGNVGIGNSSPSQRLTVIGADNTTNAIASFAANNLTQQVEIWYGGIKMGGTAAAADLNFANKGVANMLFSTNGSERMRITSGGLVGIGTSSPAFALHVLASDGLMGMFATSSTSGGYVGFRHSTSTIYGYLGTGNFLVTGASVSDFAMTTGGSGNLIFGTGAGNERMRITSGGNVGIGTTSPDVKLQISGGLNGGIKIEPNGSALTLPTSGLSFSTGYNVGYIRNANSSGTQVDLYFEVARVQFGYLGTGIIYSNGGFLTNTNPSDKRLKENINNLKYGLNEILQLRPVSYNWINDTANQGTQYGFIAQEVQEIMPELINEFITKENQEEVIRLGLDKEAIFVTLVKAIQELKAEIDELKNK